MLSFKVTLRILLRQLTNFIGFMKLCVSRAGFSLSGALFMKNVGPLPNIQIARLNSHYTHSDSVVIIDILLRTHITYTHRRCGVEGNKII